MPDVIIKGGDKWKGILARLADDMEDMGVQAGVLTNFTPAGGGASVAEYAFYNEYGTVNIPARPFMRTTVLQHEKEWASLFAQYVNGQTDNCAAIQRAWNEVGRQVAGDMIATIKSNMAPENADSTKRQKQKAVTQRKRKAGEPAVQSYVPGTLQDTGLLVNSITHKVIEGGVDE